MPAEAIERNINFLRKWCYFTYAKVQKAERIQEL